MMSKHNENKKVTASEYWIDAHCHLCNVPLQDNFKEEIKQAQEHGVELFISTALNRQEIDWHLDNISSEIRLVAGIHPFYDKSDIKDLDYLEQLCKRGQLWGIGEIGYDKRKNNHNYQKTILYQQLELALEYDLPVVFHVVHRFNELYQTLKNDFPGIRGYIHGFNGSYELVEMFSRLPIGFSVGYKLLQKKDFVSVIWKIIKHGWMLFETDAPFQKFISSEKDSRGSLADLTSLTDTISQSCNLNADVLLEKQWRTFLKMQG